MVIKNQWLAFKFFFLYLTLLLLCVIVKVSLFRVVIFIFNSVFVLALIPQDEVIGIWGKLKNSVPSVLHKPSMDKFVKYFETHYMNGCFAGMWNHYETEGPCVELDHV